MIRRSYIKTTLGAAAGAVGRQGWGGAPGPVVALSYPFGKEFPLEAGGTVPADEVRILGGYLGRYVPPGGTLDPAGGWTAVFDILDVSLPAKNGGGLAMSNSLLGQVAVARARQEPHYHVRQHFRPAMAIDEVETRIRCDADDMRSIRDYELVWKSSGSAMPYVRKETGTVQSGGLHVARGASSEAFALGNPMAALWPLLDAVRLLPASTGWSRRFDLHMDLSSLRRNQQLRFSRFGEVHTAAGVVPVRFFEQTGEGVSPIHYAVDEMQRTLFATQGLLGWGLNRIVGG